MKNKLINLTITALGAALLFAGCNKLPAEIDDPSVEEIDLAEYTITAAPAQTRTAMNASFVTTWQLMDAVSVFYRHNGKWRNAKFTHTTGNDFTGSMADPDINSDWYIQYPYSNAKTPVNAPAQVDATPVQNGYGSNDHLAGDQFPLNGSLTYTGGTTIPQFPLTHDLAILRFTVTNGEASAITITGLDFTAPSAIVGSFCADLTATPLVWSPLPEISYDTVSLTVEDGTSIAPNGTAVFYVGIMPLDATAAAGEYTIKVTATDSSDEEITSTKVVSHNDLSFPAATITSLTYTFVKDAEPVSVPAKRYELVTSAPDGYWDGEYLVLNTASDGPAKALDVFAQPVSPATETTVTGAPVDVEVVDGYVEWTSTIAQYAITVTKAEKTYTTITPDIAYNFQNSYGNYIFASSSTICLGTTNFHTNKSVEYEYYQSFYYDGGVVMRSCRIDGATSDQYYLKYSDGTFAYDKTDSNRIQVYKLVDDRTPQALSFTDASVTWTTGEGESYQIGSSYAMPQTVSGAQTAVTYSSSNTSVAEIVGSQIKINGTGTTTITATAEESADYASGSASYTLEIGSSASVTERNLGSFNLVNSNINAYLNYANSTYAEGNWGSSVITSTSSFKDNNNYTIYMGTDGDLNDYSYSGSPNESQTHTLKSGMTPKGYDYPAPVKIGSLGHNGSTATVDVYNDAARTLLENSLTTTIQDGNIDFYNLIPNRKYYYTVSVSNEEIDRGYFTTTATMNRRFLLVQNGVTFNSSGAITNPYADDANNCRDFGGLKVGSDKQLKYNLIFRGSNIDKTKNNAAEKETLLGYMGIRLDVDLRKTSSSYGDYRDFAKQIYSSYNSETIDWIGPGISGGSDLISTSATNKTKVKNILQSIIDHVIAGKPVYIHCFAGADRTGYICCLLEAVLGVSEKDCSIDYELTSFSCVRVRDRAFKLKSGAAMSDCYPFIKNYTVSGVSNPTFQQKANQIMLDWGISQTDINAFKNAMIEDIPAAVN